MEYVLTANEILLALGGLLGFIKVGCDGMMGCRGFTLILETEHRCAGW